MTSLRFTGLFGVNLVPTLLRGNIKLDATASVFLRYYAGA